MNRWIQSWYAAAKCNPAIWQYVARAGWSKIGRDLIAHGTRVGVEVRYGWGGTTLRKDGEEYWFPRGRPHLVRSYIDRIVFFRSRTLPVERSGRQVVDCRAEAQYRLPSGAVVWLPEIAEAEDIFTGYFARGEPGMGDVVFDIGAYCGEVTIELARKVGPTGRVYAFEPGAKNLRWLRRNIELNGLTNVTVVPKGVWKESGRLRFVEDGLGGSFVLGSKLESGEWVEVISVADAIALAGRMPDFIKMDIEGAEVEVVEALMAEPAAPVRLAIASYHRRDGRQTWETITPVLARNGFTVETGFPEHLTTWARRG